MPSLSKQLRMKYSAKQKSFDGDLEILNSGNGFVVNELTKDKIFVEKCAKRCNTWRYSKNFNQKIKVWSLS